VVLLVLLVVGYASAQCPTEGTLAKKLGYSEFYSQTNGILVEPFENSVFSNWDVTTNGDVSHTVTNDANPGVTVTLSGTLAKSQTTSLYFDEEAYWETGIQGENYIYGLAPLDLAVLHIEFSPPVGSFLFAANAMDQASISIFDSNNVIIGCDTIYQVSAPNGVIYYGATTVSEKIKKISIYGVSFAIDDLRFTRCPVGTSEGGYTSGEADCIDNNECELGENDCNEYALCTNVPYSFECSCEDGWEGDGVGPFGCSDVDECAVSSPCNLLASCSNLPGSFECTCAVGYTGSGIGSAECIDINECTDDPCTGGKVCSNTEGSYTCDCPPGYTEDGEDGCEMLCPENCNQNAVCIDVMGVKLCSCKEGYVGEGVGPDGCTDLNECATLSPCHSAADCTNSEGSFSCACHSGYTGTGVGPLGCTDIDECSTLTPCSLNADCDNTPGTFTCTCADGFAGDGLGSSGCTGKLSHYCSADGVVKCPN
jgi:hypothetical protein